MSDKKQSIGGGWIKTTKTGKQVMSVSLMGKRFTAWPNDRKKNPNEPDWRFYEDDYKPAEKVELPEQSNDLPF